MKPSTAEKKLTNSKIVWESQLTEIWVIPKRTASISPRLNAISSASKTVVTESWSGPFIWNNRFLSLSQMATPNPAKTVFVPPWSNLWSKDGRIHYWCRRRILGHLLVLKCHLPSCLFLFHADTCVLSVWVLYNLEERLFFENRKESL